MIDKPLIYLAAPYTKGDMALNVRSQLMIYDELIRDGIVIPLAPLLSHFAHMINPMGYEEWLAFDFEMLYKCDGCLYMEANVPEIDYYLNISAGATREKEFCNENAIEVFSDKRSLYVWVNNTYNKFGV